MHRECRMKVISMEAKQKGATEQRAAMTIRYGKTLYQCLESLQDRKPDHSRAEEPVQSLGADSLLHPVAGTQMERKAPGSESGF